LVSVVVWGIIVFDIVDALEESIIELLVDGSRLFKSVDRFVVPLEVV